MKAALLAAVALVALVPSAHATLITTTNIFAPQAGSGAATTPVDLTGIIPPSQASITGNGYSITVATASNEGIVQGSASGLYAVPVAGVMNGQPVYLTGNLGSVLTPTLSESGNYFSTGGPGASITIDFATAQTSLALLWGSIDGSNEIQFESALGVVQDTLTGVEVQQELAQVFAGEGSQGLGGSAYVDVTAATPFSRIVLTSGVFSFEAAALIGSDTPFTVPEPISLVLFGSGLAAIGMIRRQRPS